MTPIRTLNAFLVAQGFVAAFTSVAWASCPSPWASDSDPRQDPTLWVTRADLSKAESSLSCRKEELRGAEERVATTLATVDAKLQDVAAGRSGEGEVAAAVEANENAFDVRDSAQLDVVEAERDLAALDYRVHYEQRWRHAFAVSASAARAADGLTQRSISPRWLHRLNPGAQSEVYLSWSKVSPADPESSARDELLSAGLRINFGRQLWLFSLGAGLGTTSSDTLNDPTAYVVQPELGVVARLPRDCPEPGCRGWPFADARFFARPWLPLNGEAVSVLFGLEVGVGLGWSSPVFQPSTVQEPSAQTPQRR